MKKTLAIAAVCLAGCLAVTAAGCSKSTRNLAALSSNWYSDPDFKRIQPAFTDGDDNFAPEKVTYTVSQTGKSENSSFSVEYADGTYTTEFFAERIYADKLAEITKEEWRTPYEDVLSSGGYIVVYCYKTELKIPSVTFKFGEETRIFENEYRTTLSYFLSVEDYLSPVYSLQEVKSTSPIDGGYMEVDRVYESFYTLSGSDVETVITDNLAEKDEDKISYHNVGGMAEHAYSVFDNTYLDVVVRGMRNMSSSLNQAISTYTPGTQIMDYVLTGSDTALCASEEDSENQLAEIQNILKEKNLFVGGKIENEDGTTTEEKLKTVAVNVVFNNGELSGVSQRYWFAAADSKNKTRTLMVKYSVPLTYSLGTLEYVLKSIDSLPNV